MNDVRVKLPKEIEDGGMRWKVLERTGNVVFIEGKPSDGLGKKRYDVTFVKVDGDGMEFINGNYNFDGSKDSPTWDKEVMAQAFRRAVELAEKAGRDRVRNAEEEKKRQSIYNLWLSNVDAIRVEQAALIEQLKTLTRNEKNVLGSKKIMEISSRLGQIEALLHHGTPSRYE